MLLRAGLVSVILLLASRALGLLRETAQASAFGATAAGDVAVLMFTLPDLVAGIFVSGALSYVLLPAWAQASAMQIANQQRRVARVVLIVGLVVVLLVWLTGPWLAQALAAGAVQAMGAQGVANALVWSALSVPLALLAALWTTRLQHAHDAIGMYAANLVVNAVVIIAILFIAIYAALSGANGQFDHQVWALLGLGLLLAGALRLLWLRWRMGRAAPALGLTEAAAAPLPVASVWLWAAMSAGLPLALVLVARSSAAATEQGALASFNYAWKLIELPLVLAVQLVATLAFAHVAQRQGAARDEALQRALVLAWVLACSACAAVAGFAPALAPLLFGYGRMDASGLQQVALWAQVGAWSLLPQAVIAVLLTLLATVQSLRPVAIMYGCACLGLALAAQVFVLDGWAVMLSLTAALLVLAVGCWWLARPCWQGAWPWADALMPLLACALLVVLAQAAQDHWLPWGRVVGTMLAAAAALVVWFVAWWSSPRLREMLNNKT